MPEFKGLPLDYGIADGLGENVYNVANGRNGRLCKALHMADKPPFSANPMAVCCRIEPPSMLSITDNTDGTLNTRRRVKCSHDLSKVIAGPALHFPILTIQVST
jgi:hypothetical protein